MEENLGIANNNSDEDPLSLPTPIRQRPPPPQCSNDTCQNQRMVRYGSFSRRGSFERVQRYRCPTCKKTKSSATGSPSWWEKKPHINGQLLGLLASKVSMRRSAMLLGVNRRTIHRKLARFAEVAGRCLNKNLQATRNFDPQEGDPETDHFAANRKPKINSTTYKHVVFDEVITKETTKFKPLAIALLVANPSRVLIGFELGDMEAQESLLAEGEARFGPRKDERAAAITSLLKRSKIHLESAPVILTDKDPLYPSVIHSVIPDSIHVRIKSRRAHSSGQGELKKVGFDPFFSLNHTAAMMRDSVSRLVRRTWAISRSKERLKDHLTIYQWFHNEVLLLPKKLQNQRFRELGSILSSRVALEDVNHLVSEFNGCAVVTNAT
jgi:transposase-like protein